MYRGPSADPYGGPSGRLSPYMVSSLPSETSFSAHTSFDGGDSSVLLELRRKVCGAAGMVWLLLVGVAAGRWLLLVCLCQRRKGVATRHARPGRAVGASLSHISQTW